jgi:hypothetical protein
MRALRWACFLLLAWPPEAQAYVGPGLGTGVVATVLGILTSIILVLIAIIWYPLKRLYRRVRQLWRSGQ